MTLKDLAQPMNHFTERRRPKNITLDADLMSALEAEALKAKLPISHVIEGRIRASYAAETGEEVRIWEALHQLQRDMDTMMQVILPLATWLGSMGLMGDVVVEPQGNVPSPGAPASDTKQVSSEEFYRQVMPPEGPTPPVVDTPKPARKRWWE